MSQSQPAASLRELAEENERLRAELEASIKARQRVERERAYDIAIARDLGAMQREHLREALANLISAHCGAQIPKDSPVWKALQAAEAALFPFPCRR